MFEVVVFESSFTLSFLLRLSSSDNSEESNLSLFSSVTVFVSNYFGLLLVY